MGSLFGEYIVIDFFGERRERREKHMDMRENINNLPPSPWPPPNGTESAAFWCGG